jgi:DNA polymerase I
MLRKCLKSVAGVHQSSRLVNGLAIGAGCRFQYPHENVFGDYRSQTRTVRSSIVRSFATSAPSTNTNPMNESLGSTEGDYERLKGKPNPAMDVIAKVGVPGVTIVRDEVSARKVVEILKTLKDRVHAWDTETIDLEVKEQSPVGKGKIMCFTAFCGPDVDFGSGPRLFIDNMSSPTDLVQVFKEYFEDETYLKGWFNYGFDRHILFNHGVDVK